MLDNLNKDLFLRAANDWVCDSYSADIRYIGRKDGEEICLIAAYIGLAPLPPTENIGFNIEVNGLYAGQIQLIENKENLLKILNMAAQGQLEAHDHLLTLKNERQYSYHSDMNFRDRWFYDLHLQVVGNTDVALSQSNLSGIDNALRQCSTPFDGLSDLFGWLGLKDPQFSRESLSINIRILPPVDLILSNCRLDKDKLQILLNAHPDFDLARLGLAVRAVPGNGVSSRKQVSAHVKWKKVRKGRREGRATITLRNADSALAMLMIGETTVRRQWFLDPVKGDNNRLIAVQHFDKDLRMIRSAIFDQTDSARFELGVSALLFLMGFSSAVQVETDSPDIVATTPGGRLVLVECTTRIADFNSKLGKLVDRKGSLLRALQEIKKPSRVDAVLVCALPKDQVASRSDDLQAHQVILVTKDELVSAFEQLRLHIDPDKTIEELTAKMARENQFRLGI
ncbi:MAG: Uncharacterized protein AWT59_0532 [Candidatus Gallionella acididurans]|uniref:Uncharacterized protein n=1 Tax=Candidatus Gallionella acididurans TaxID=1796491 RepID=A0A139BWP2_9PROT|nr:MAG: Uncharacterized protein AWT59_0532 [Candidatus Gallionella acididurans]